MKNQVLKKNERNYVTALRRFCPIYKRLRLKYGATYTAWRTMKKKHILPYFMTTYFSICHIIRLSDNINAHRKQNMISMIDKEAEKNLSKIFVKSAKGRCLRHFRCEQTYQNNDIAPFACISLAFDKVSN